MLKTVRNLTVVSILFFILASFSIYSYASEEIYVVPSGEAVGVKIYTDGLLVVGMSPEAKDNGINVNDQIESVNGTTIVSNEQFAGIVNKNPDKLTITINRNGEKFNLDVKPHRGEDGIYRLGLWVRDSTAGIGTVTYFNPVNNTFAALGHGITDIDTGNILTVKSGNILPCRIVSVIKSENGHPGELSGTFEGKPSGKIIMNTENGIYGKCNFNKNSDAIPVASIPEIEEGAASILANIDGNGVKEYSAEITKVYSGNRPSKNMVIEITDENLLNITGGIVQGMSGAPIIQNGKLVGAVTHVFVNDSSKGYGVFAENMLNISENID